MEHNNQYLHPNVAVIKRICLDHNRHMGCSSCEENPANLQRTATFVKITNSRDICTDKTEINVNRDANKRHSNRTNQCNYYATSVTANLANHHHLLNIAQICIGRNYLVLIITRLIFTNAIKYDVYLV